MIASLLVQSQILNATYIRIITKWENHSLIFHHSECQLVRCTYTQIYDCSVIFTTLLISIGSPTSFRFTLLPSMLPIKYINSMMLSIAYVVSIDEPTTLLKISSTASGNNCSLFQIVCNNSSFPRLPFQELLLQRIQLFW